MQEDSPEEKTAQPSLDELRESFAAKELAKERERQRLSRKTTKYLVIGALVLIGAVVVFPDKKMEPVDAASASGAAESDADKGDLKFAMELMQYVQPGAPRSEPERAEGQ